MGNNHSASNKSGRPASPSPASTSASASALGHDSPRHHRKDASRNIIPIHTAHRAVVPPEPSLAQAQGSTAGSLSNPKILPPTTAVSSLSASPHSNVSTTPAKSSESRPVAAFLDEPSKPVDVPIEAASFRSHHSHQPHLTNVPDSILMATNSLTDMYINRPPRLPLPIEEEVHTPGSPILGPDETLTDIDLGESSDGLTRKSSALSTNTLEEDEGEELRVDKTRPVVPTRLEWRGGGEKIYVTGTIFQWNRKHRLHPVEGQPGVFAATIYILPGTHHVRFLVDGIMQTSPGLPTTVDFGNNLVNYIEVNPDDARKDKPFAPAADEEDGQASRTPSQLKEQRAPKGKAVLPPDAYNHPIPQYLLDFDQAEDSPAYRNAVAAIEKLPTPPSLPGFLGKPILNAATLMKDDNSVLNMPNHTVLNHLATSSIKNNVLAVSATTRYHNKYVTTIIYKPTSSDEG
ncbi:5'-AMP-activated protein kinase subunit beta [Cladobotryum mycophilum]|uniref:5'-AMP-activated protein kinase subunit beta n=1 Tax=Cladobotryum mycophilum TaxID=491253 RepID=A0ABR0SM25_9HYPO